MKYLTERTNKKLGPLLEEPNNRVGLLLNERFINIPPQVSVPLLENLRYVYSPSFFLCHGKLNFFFKQRDGNCKVRGKTF